MSMEDTIKTVEINEEGKTTFIGGSGKAKDIKFNSKLTKVGKKDKPSYYILVPKYIVIENGLKDVGDIEVELKHFQVKQ